jgi:hypothetical protein
MTFSLFVLSAGIDDGERIFNLAALTVFVSIIAHGLTDTPGAEWLARRHERGTKRHPAPQGATAPGAPPT